MAKGRIIICKPFKYVGNNWKDGSETELLRVRCQPMMTRGTRSPLDMNQIAGWVVFRKECGKLEVLKL